MSMLATFAVGAAGGWLAYWAGVPAGALVGSMIAVGALRLLGAPLREVPMRFRRGAMVVVGILLGAAFNWRDLMLTRLLLPAVVLTLLLAGLSALTAWIVVRRTGWTWTAAIMATAPAGMTEISLSADTMGLDGAVIATLHLIRVATVIGLAPWIVRLLT